jgi:hypothetical protein
MLAVASVTDADLKRLEGLLDALKEALAAGIGRPQHVVVRKELRSRP